jgi:mRNA-degrading endonuclease RelE of RelBE toxin-antitoxin system
MRNVRLSKTFIEQLNALLTQGVAPFGPRLVAEKRDLVYAFIADFLARYPAAKRPHARLGLRTHAVRKTPFVLIYDFDDAELRVHFVVHKHASLEDLDPKSAEW